VRASWRTASSEDLITELERQQRENERLRRGRERAEQERDRYSLPVARVPPGLRRCALAGASRDAISGRSAGRASNCRAFHIAIGFCEACVRRLQGRHPLQTSDAIGAAASQLGPEAVTLAVVLNKQLGLPLGKIAMPVA
jgi:hypothetical protein